MATSIIYNGITILDVLTESVNQEVEMDSGVRPLYRKTTIKCTGLIWAITSIPAIYDLGIATLGSLTTGFSDTLRLLSTPQKEFTYTIDGTNIFHVTGRGIGNPGNDMDVKNGPITEARFLHIVGNKSARIEFTVTFWRKACGGQSQQNNTEIMSLKFSQTEDINEQWFLTRTYRGHLIIRPGSKPISVHSFQGWCLPPITRGFLRQFITFIESDDGLRLDFTITDRQVYAYPPLPAVKWTGRHSVIFPTTGANKAESEYSIAVEGPPSASKEALFAVCYNIMVAKLYLFDALNEGGDLIQTLRFDEDITGPKISAYARVLHTNFTNLIGQRRTFLKPLDKKFNGSFIHPQKETGLRGIFAQAVYKDPCTKVAPWDYPVEPDTGTGETGTAKRYPKNKTEQAQGGGGVFNVPPSLPPVNSLARNETTSTTAYFVSSQCPVNENIAWYSDGLNDTIYMAQVASPSAKRIVTIEASRINAYPVIPKRSNFVDMNRIEHRVLKWHPELQIPQLSADGRKTLYSVNMLIEYLMSRAPRPGERLPTGTPPYIASGIATNYLGPELQLQPGDGYTAIQ